MYFKLLTVLFVKNVRLFVVNNSTGGNLHSIGDWYVHELVCKITFMFIIVMVCITIFTLLSLTIFNFP